MNWRATFKKLQSWLEVVATREQRLQLRLLMKARGIIDKAERGAGIVVTNKHIYDAVCFSIALDSLTSLVLAFKKTWKMRQPSKWKLLET